MQDVDLLQDAVLEAGRLAMSLFRQSVRNWRKDDHSPVSEADLAVNRVLHHRLTGARPGYGWLSEESEDGPGRLSASHCWVVDPIDGTRAFLKGGDQWCVAAALVRNGAPVAAAVYRPVGEEFHMAELGSGAALNKKPIRATARIDLSGARVFAARQLLAKCQGAVPANVAETPLAMRLCLVARSEADAFAAVTPKNDWDICAGQLIVTEAGGRVTDLSGADPVYNRTATYQRGIVAAGHGLHGLILKAVT